MLGLFFVLNASTNATSTDSNSRISSKKKKRNEKIVHSHYFHNTDLTVSGDGKRRNQKLFSGVVPLICGLTFKFHSVMWKPSRQYVVCWVLNCVHIFWRIPFVFRLVFLMIHSIRYFCLEVLIVDRDFFPIFRKEWFKFELVFNCCFFFVHLTGEVKFCSILLIVGKMNVVWKVMNGIEEYSSCQL